MGLRQGDFARGAARSIAALVLLGIVAPPASAFEGNVNLFVGKKWFAGSDWAPIDEQLEYGILLAFAEQRAPIHFAIDVLVAKDEHAFDEPVLGVTRVEGGTIEYAVGVRKVFRRGAVFHPHLGGGGAVVTAAIEADVEGIGRRDLRDTAFGFWVDAGITWRLARHVNLGAEIRYSRARIDLGNISTEIEIAGGGFHAGVLVGYGW